MGGGVCRAAGYMGGIAADGPGHSFTSLPGPGVCLLHNRPTFFSAHPLNDFWLAMPMDRCGGEGRGGEGVGAVITGLADGKLLVWERNTISFLATAGSQCPPCIWGTSYW